MVLTTSLAGWILDADPAYFRTIYGAGALFGCVGMWLFRGVLVRGEKRHRVMERRGAQDGRRKDGFLAVLRKDTLYARYQLHQFISGTANMMQEPPLVYVPGSTGLSAWLFMLSAVLGVVAGRGFDTLRKDVRLRPLNR